MKSGIIPIWLLISILTPGIESLEITRARLQIRENRDRAQLSIVLQVANPDQVPENSTPKKALVEAMKIALKNGLSQRTKLRYHKSFSHVFITAINKSSDEELLALFSKTPLSQYPSINFFPGFGGNEKISKKGKKEVPPPDLFAQLDKN
jgi:hypothetical protein